MYSTHTCGYLAHTYTYVMLSTIAAFLPVYYSQACATQVVVVERGPTSAMYSTLTCGYLHVLLYTSTIHKHILLFASIYCYNAIHNLGLSLVGGEGGW